MKDNTELLDRLNDETAAREQQDLPTDDSSERAYQELEKGRLDLEKNQQNLGLLGKLFGDQQTAPSNIAGLTVMLSLFALSSLVFSAPEDPGTVQTIREVFLSTLLASLGYLFGKSSKS